MENQTKYQPPKRDAVAEERQHADRLLARARAITTYDGTGDLISLAREIEDRIQIISKDAAFFFRLRANALQSDAAIVKAVDVKRSRELAAQADDLLAQAQDLEKLVAPLRKERERLLKIFNAATQRPTTCNSCGHELAEGGE